MKIVKYKVEFADAGNNLTEEVVEADEIRDSAEGKWVDFYQGDLLERRFTAVRVIGVKAVK